MSGSDSRRVLICDDAVAFPRLVELWLDNGGDVVTAGVVQTAPELLDRVARADDVDVLLLDLMLPDGPATPELVGGVRERAPAVKIVLVSNLPHDALQEEARRLGVDACLSKATTPEGLLAAIREV